MECPDTSILRRFTSDPELLGDSLLSLEAHISNCGLCQRNLELATQFCELPNLLGIDELTSEFDIHVDQPPIIPGYSIERLAGRGGFAAVYQARQISTGRQVAIKISRNQSRNQLKRNQLEANVAAQLDHPNLVRLYDYGSNDLYSYCIFEWVDENLSERLSGSLISLTQVVEWMLQLSQAVIFLHQLRIIHRDLKPSNILITSGDQVKLTDFGIVKDLSDPANTATHTRAIGTPGFMSPEQVGLNGIPVGPYTDVYGLGAVLYAMLVGHAPFVGGDSATVLRQVVEQKPHAPSKVRSDLPRDLEIICLKCLEKDHHDRYASVVELSRDLQRFADGLPIRARRLSRPARLWRACKRQPLVASLSGVISVLMLLGLCLAALGYRRAQIQQANLLAQSFCQIILSASPDRLGSLYEQAGDYSAEAIQRNIDALSDDPQLNDLGRIRLLCLKPQHSSSSFTPERLLVVVEKLSAQETLAMIGRLKKCSIVDAPSMVELLKSSVKNARPDSSKLPVISILAALDPQWNEWGKMADKVLRSLALSTAEDATHWATLLKPIDGYLLEAVVEQTDAQSPLDSEFFARQASTTDLNVTTYLESPLVFAGVWQWAQGDLDGIVPLIRSIPVSKLANLRSLSHAQRQSTVARLRKEIDSVRTKLFEWRSMPRSQELSASISKSGGLMSGRGGYITAMLQSEAPTFIELLSKHGMGLTSIQPYRRHGQDWFSAVFERTAETEEERKLLTADVCKVSWSIPLENVESEVALNAEQGLHVEAFWAIPEDPVRRVAILWRKSASSVNHIVWDTEKVDALAAKLGQLDSSELETQLFKQSITLDSQQSTSWTIALLKQRPIAARDERTRRFVQLVPRSIGFQPATAPTPSVEHISAGSSYLSVVASLPTLSAQGQSLLDNGYQPLDMCVEPTTDQALSHWCLKESPARERLRQEMASLVIAAWFLDDLDPLLDAIVFSRDPSLRTRIVEQLGDVNQNPTSFQVAWARQLTIAQSQGLLLALGNWHPDRLKLYKEELSPWLKAMWDHNDSGLHFTADQLLRRMGVPENQRIVRDDLIESHGLAQCPQGRKWYYGPFGLPFVIVDPIEIDMLGCDERIPWISTIDRRMGTLRRRLAVCAIETPDWLMHQHIDESKQFHEGLRLPQNTVTDGPAAGYTLYSTLHFCNWLSTKDGITADTIFIPPRKVTEENDEAKDQPRPIARCFLEADGYRLPTNLEWEMCARAGTWTSNHLGDRFDFLSNYSWSSANCESHPRAIGLLKPNPLGLFDVLGNVYEYALGGNSVTGFDDDPETYADTTHNPSETVNIRGGSFLSSRIYCSSGAGHHILIRTGDVNAGFRVVRTLTDD